MLVDFIESIHYEEGMKHKSLFITFYKFSVTGERALTRAYIRAKDRIGTTIKNLKILDYKRENKETYFYIECLLCGNKKWMYAQEVVSGRSVSCGCYNKSNNLKKAKDLTGQKFGELTVLKATEKRSRNGSVIWECKCSCGNYISVSSQRLKDGSVKSCGCLKSKISKNKAEKMSEIILEGCIEDTNIRNLTSKIPKNNTSGHKGVSWDKTRQKWVAQIVFQGKTYHLGRYYKKEDAIFAREEAEKKLFGNFLKEHEIEVSKTKKNKKQHKKIKEGEKIKVYEIITKVVLLKEIEIKQLRRNLVYFIDSILVKDDVYKEFHGENKLKGYTLDLLYPMEKNRVYKKDKVYSFRIRTVNKSLAEYLSKNSIQHITDEFIGIQSIIKIIPRKILKTLYTVTPVIVKTQEHCYWRECLSLEKYEEQLKKNLWKKYRNFTGKEPNESLAIWDSLVFKNQGVIPFPYKNITLPGDKLELLISDNEQAQEIAYMMLATGLGDLNNRGAGFVGYRYKDGIKNK